MSKKGRRKKMSIVGLDIGFGWTKVCWINAISGISKIKFPTVFTIAKEELMFGHENTFHVFNGEKYYVGENAIVSPRAIAIRNYKALIEHAPLFAAEAISRIGNEIKPQELIIASGLPPLDLRQNAKKLTEILKQIPLKGITLTPKAVEIFPQAASVFVEVIKNNMVDIKPNHSIMIIDIGHNTVDVVPALGSRIIEEGILTIDGAGLHKALTDLVTSLRTKYHLTYTTHEAIDVLKTKTIVKSGQEMNIQSLVDNILDQYSKWLSQLIYEKWDEFIAKAIALVFIGGCAELIKQYIQKYFDMEIIVPSEAEFTNAKCFLLFAASKYGITVFPT